MPRRYSIRDLMLSVGLIALSLLGLVTFLDAPTGLRVGLALEVGVLFVPLLVAFAAKGRLRVFAAGTSAAYILLAFAVLATVASWLPIVHGLLFAYARWVVSIFHWLERLPGNWGALAFLIGSIFGAQLAAAMLLGGLLAACWPIRDRPDGRRGGVSRPGKALSTPVDRPTTGDVSCRPVDMQRGILGRLARPDRPPESPRCPGFA